MRRSWPLVGARRRSVAARLRCTHVCRVADDARSVTTFRTCPRGRCGTAWCPRGRVLSAWPATRSTRTVQGLNPLSWCRNTASWYPRVKARAASHRACASSSVRHDTTSLPFFSFLLALPTPPPRTPLAVSLWPRFLPGVEGLAVGERLGGRSLNKRRDDVSIAVPSKISCRGRGTVYRSPRSHPAAEIARPRPTFRPPGTTSVSSRGLATRRLSSIRAIAQLESLVTIL